MWNLPYIAPEVLNKQPHNKASDIYSFGIIMWEILYGKPVPFEQDSMLQSKIQFQIQVCGGLRPPIHENTAMCYIDLMKKCRHTDPEKRPTAKEVYEIFVELNGKITKPFYQNYWNQIKITKYKK